MSPDGNHVAFTTSLSTSAYEESDYTHLREIYLSNKKGKLVPFVTANIQGHLSWGSDSKHIWFLSKREKDETVSLYRMSISGGEPQKVFSYQTDIKGYHIANDDRKLIFWAYPPKNKRQEKIEKLGFDAIVVEENVDIQHLFKIELFTENAKLQTLVNDKHIIFAQWNSSQQDILVQHTPTSLTDDLVMHKSLSVITPSGVTKHTFQHVGKMGKAQFSPDGNAVAVIGSLDATDPEKGRLYIGNIASRKLIHLLPNFNGHVKDIYWLGNKSIGFVAHQGLDSFLASKKTNKPSDSYRVLLKNAGIITGLSADEAGKNIALNSHSSEHPNELYWYKKSGTRRYTNSNLWLKDKKLVKQKRVSFNARDGIEIQGILVPPSIKQEGKAALIIFVHGGPESHVSDGWLNRYSHPINEASNNGFYSFLPNYRGSTGRGVAFSKMGQNDYAGAEFDDLIDAKRWAIENYDIDPSRVGITGASYGGYAAAWAATKFSKEFAASVSSMGIANQVSKFATTDIPTEMIRLHAFQYPWQDWQWYQDRSPISFIENTQTPLLLMHGQLDERVPYSQSVELFRHWKLRSNTPIRLVLFPTEEHGFASPAARLEYSERLMRWMTHFLQEKRSDLPPMELPHLPLD